MCTIERSRVGVSRSNGVVYEDTVARAETRRLAAEVADVLVAGDGPEAGCTFVHGFLGTQHRQQLVVILPGEERVALGIHLTHARVRIGVLSCPGAPTGRRRGNNTPLVPGHSGSVLCSVVLTHDQTSAAA